jgi:hypothetical protein
MAGIPTLPIAGITLSKTVAGTGTSYDQGGEFALGTQTPATDNQQWVYVHASAAITRYRFVGIDEDFETAPLTAAMVLDGWQIGVADAVAFADNDFGWVCTKGANITGSVALNTAADVQLYTSSTAGVLQAGGSTLGTSVASMVVGVVAVTANALTSVGANVEVMVGTYMYPAAQNY